MTRFARAKGSKSSNEKAPEDGTPWEVMKEQLSKAKKENEDAKKRQESEKQRMENYENFLKEHKVQKRKATWCDFPETENDKKLNLSQSLPSPSKKKKNKNKAKNQLNTSNDISQPVNTMREDLQIDTNDFKVQTEQEQPRKKKKIKKHTTQIDLNNSNDNTTDNGNLGNENVSTPDDSKLALPETPQKIGKKKKKNKNKKPTESFNTNQNVNNTTTDTNNDSQGSENTAQKITPQNKAKKKKGKKANPNGDTIDKTQINKENKIKALKKKKSNKLIDGQPVRRKEVSERSFQLIINGKDIELVRFDGFPVMRKDADRLEDLKKNMLTKGIPKSEVQRTLKLERRRAEKALARLKRDVCYNCRKGGHNLSDCPELKSKIPGVDGADGVCFKCGSTEHRQFECKVQRDKEFRFATCFICKEQGHIARQCPDNPKGLYPNGGNCKLCGDVTHLRKDCPTANDKKEGTSMKLHTLDSSDNIEGIGQQIQGVPSEETMKKPKKIKF